MDRKAGLGSDELHDAFEEMTPIDVSDIDLEFVTQSEDTLYVKRGSPTSELVTQFEDTLYVHAWPVYAAASEFTPVYSPAGPNKGGSEPPDSDFTGNAEFDVILEAPGEKKIHVMKEVRALTALGLRDAKKLVESAPTPVLEKVARAVAKKAHAVLVGAGAGVSIRSARPSPAEVMQRHGGGEEFQRRVRARLLEMLAGAEGDRALDADELALMEWLAHPLTADGSVGMRLAGLLETAAAFLEMWDGELFANWLFDPSPHLDGATPADLIALGRTPVVLESLEDSAYGVYA